MSAALTALRTAWLSMLMLLLGLMPFIHGHLGQPVQSGWHIHALSAVEEVQASTQFDGLACLVGHQRAASQQHGLVLHAPEPSDIEPATGIAQSRLSELRAAAVAAADTPALAARPAAAALQLAARCNVVAWQSAPRHALSGSRPGLPPPAQGPPTNLA